MRCQVINWSSGTFYRDPLRYVKAAIFSVIIYYEAKIKHETATITAQKQCCKEFTAQRHNREDKNQTRVRHNYRAKQRCKELAGLRRNHEAQD